MAPMMGKFLSVRRLPDFKALGRHETAARRCRGCPGHERPPL